MNTPVIREMQPKERAVVASFAKLAPPGGAGAVALVALLNGTIVGYAEMAPTFFQQPFVSLLSVRPEQHRQGVASALMQAMETKCLGGKLFTSTNQSNSAMQALLAKMDYRLCGAIEELDEGDPELIFVKRLRSAP